MNKNLLRQAQQLQARLLKAQQELPNLTAEATAGGGAIAVVASGDQRIRSIKIQKDVVSADDVEMLEDLVLAAVNDALEKSKEAASKHMSAITGGLGLPPGLV
ncbi:MAG: YbaB/EbfC family nucleoid-associated protein [Dehalococcoidia bacterium]|nr:YbaB/EbfC family nucleoid-associated protein [Dehalococcoidia bacterium]